MTTLPDAIELEANVTNIETAQTERWLTKTLAPARRAAIAGPTPRRSTRMRARVFGRGRDGRSPGASAHRCLTAAEHATENASESKPGGIFLCLRVGGLTGTDVP